MDFLWRHRKPEGYILLTFFEKNKKTCPIKLGQVLTCGATQIRPKNGRTHGVPSYACRYNGRLPASLLYSGRPHESIPSSSFAAAIPPPAALWRVFEKGTLLNQRFLAVHYSTDFRLCQSFFNYPRRKALPSAAAVRSNRRFCPDRRRLRPLLP